MKQKGIVPIIIIAVAVVLAVAAIGYIKFIGIENQSYWAVEKTDNLLINEEQANQSAELAAKPEVIIDNILSSEFEVIYNLDCASSSDDFQNKHPWYGHFKEQIIIGWQLENVCYNQELNKAIYVKQRFLSEDYRPDPNNEMIYGFSRLGIYNIESDEYDEAPQQQLSYFESCRNIKQWSKSNIVTYVCGAGDGGMGIKTTYTYNVLSKKITAVKWCDLGIGRSPEEICTVDTVNWQFYKNEKYGFEIKYPKEWIINGAEEGGDVFAFKVSSTENKSQTEVSGINLVIYKNASKNLEEFVEQETQKVFVAYNNLYDPDISAENAERQEWVVGDIRGIRTVYYGGISPATIAFIKNNYIFSITKMDSFLHDDIVFDTILSTFKFIEPATIDTSDWQTYRNENLDIIFNYPSRWAVKEKPTAVEDIFYQQFIVSPTELEDKFAADTLVVQGISDEYEYNPPGTVGFFKYENLESFCKDGCKKVNKNIAIKYETGNSGDLYLSALVYTDLSKKYKLFSFELILSNRISFVSDKEKINYYDFLAKYTPNEIVQKPEMQKIVKEFEGVAGSIRVAE